MGLTVEDLERGLAGGRARDGMPTTDEQLAERSLDPGVVVHHQDAAHAQSMWAGRRMAKTAPGPPCGSSSSRPPWRFTMFAATQRPRPVPRGFVVTNGSNSRSRIELGTPGPESH